MVHNTNNLTYILQAPSNQMSTLDNNLSDKLDEEKI